MKYVRLTILVIYLTIFVSAGAHAYQNRAEIRTWYKEQVKMVKRDCQLRMIKEQFLRLQQKYGPEGAIEA